MNIVIEKLTEICADVSPQTRIRESADLDRKFAEIGIDSLEAMSIILAAVDHFQVEIADEEVDDITTLNGLARLLKARTGELHTSAG